MALVGKVIPHLTCTQHQACYHKCHSELFAIQSGLSENSFDILMDIFNVPASYIKFHSFCKG